MKRQRKLENWELIPSDSDVRPGEVRKYIFENAYTHGDKYSVQFPLEVQEALIQTGVIKSSLLEDGDSRYCNWVQEKDWIYRCHFSVEDIDREQYLIFKGIDTVADIFLNGIYLGKSESAYLEYRFETAGILRFQNTIEVYIHSPEKMLKLYEKDMPKEWIGEVEPLMMFRKGRDYGARFGFMPVGLFDDVILEEVDETALEYVDYRIYWNTDQTKARLCFKVKLIGKKGKDIRVKIRVDEEVTERLWEKEICGWKTEIEECEIAITNPLLWWPKNYGGQPLYKINVTLYEKNIIRDEFLQHTGLRFVRMIDSMRFEVNGKEVRLWGAGITPICGISHGYYEGYARDMLDKLEKCNMNAVRIWGPGKANPDTFYDELDRRGILAWQDFPTGTWQMPDNEQYKALYKKEAEWMVQRLKHHPSIILWCGGNEHIYMCELDGKKGRRGFEMLYEGYREVCHRLDPDRYYHISCPYEGKYANDPSFGDSHGSRAYCAYTPGEDYGVFFSEDIRVFPPQYKSAVRFMKEDIWEEGYVDYKPFGKEFAMPEGWKKHFSNNGHLKLGPIRKFYDAENAEELIYKYAAAAAWDLYRIGANARTGNPEYKQLEKRKRTGHLFWKFNDTWPRFYCAFYDYYQECTLPYYTVKRVFSPFLLHIDVKDHLYLWGVNDTAEDISGDIKIKVFHILQNQVINEITFPAAYAAGHSSAICIDELGPINWNCIIYAEFTNVNEKVSAEAFVTDENMLAFPEAKLEITLNGDIITVSTDFYARCVELKGISNEGDEFGWYFSDNYFDLFPFERKEIKVESRHSGGKIEGKAHYSKKSSQVLWGI